MFLESIKLFSCWDIKRESNWDPIEDHQKDGPTMGDNPPKDSSLLRKASLCIGCSFSFNGTPRTLGKWNIVEPIWRSWQNLTKWEQFTGHKLLFMVFNLIPDVWETLSIVSESEVSEEFFCPRFRWNSAHLKINKNKFSQFSSFLILLKKCGKKSDSSLKIGKNFTKDFPVKKFFQGNPL